MENKKYTRLISCMKRALNGETLTIGFLGGSITQGSLATDDKLTYAYRVYKWWCESFPMAKFEYVNGGIGGTSSHFGVSRAVRDVLMYQPDVVTVDFSVNDEPNTFFQETYEGILRKVAGWQSRPAVVVLNNVYYDTGINAQEYHNAVADYYDIPHVSIRDTIYKRMKEGMYTREELTPDGLHPNDKGHGLVADEIISLLETVKATLTTDSLTTDCSDALCDTALPKPMTQNAYENAALVTIADSAPILSGFRADTHEKQGHLDCFKNGWTARNVGDRISFVADASCIAIQYRKTIHKPAPVARVLLDGKEISTLDANFEETWGDCLFLTPILHHGEKCRHTVDIEITHSSDDVQSDFYLLSLITA